jgi:hypothetical protein
LVRVLLFTVVVTVDPFAGYYRYRGGNCGTVVAWVGSVSAALVVAVLALPITFTVATISK